MVGSVELSVAFTNMINMYLDSPHEEEIRRFAGDGKADLGGYARETLSMFDCCFCGAAGSHALICRAGASIQGRVS